MVNKNKVKARTFLQQMSISLLKKKKRISSISNAIFVKTKAITPANILKKKERAQKLVLVLTISILVIIAQKKLAKNAETSEIDEKSENGKNREKGENLGTNFA